MEGGTAAFRNFFQRWSTAVDEPLAPSALRSSIARKEAAFEGCASQTAAATAFAKDFEESMAAHNKEWLTWGTLAQYSVGLAQQPVLTAITTQLDRLRRGTKRAFEHREAQQVAASLGLLEAPADAGRVWPVAGARPPLPRAPPPGRFLELGPPGPFLELGPSSAGVGAGARGHSPWRGPDWSRAARAAVGRKLGHSGMALGTRASNPGRYISLVGNTATWGASSYFANEMLAEATRWTSRVQDGGFAGIDPRELLPALMCQGATEDALRAKVPVELANRPETVRLLSAWWVQGAGDAFRADF